MDGVDGGCAVGGGPGFVGIPPYLVRQAQVPFPGEFIPPALLSPRLPESGPPNLRRNALSGLQTGRRGPSRRFYGERGGGRDCRKPGEIADLTLSSGRGPGRVSPQVSISSWKCAKIRLSSSENAQNQVGVDPAVAPPCAHRARSHEARRPWPMRAGWPYTDQQPKLPNGPCSSSRLMVVVSRGIPIPIPRSWKTDSASSFQQTMRTGQPSPLSLRPTRASPRAVRSYSK